MLFVTVGANVGGAEGVRVRVGKMVGLAVGARVGAELFVTFLK
jgi:hypothetical protein